MMSQHNYLKAFAVILAGIMLACFGCTKTEDAEPAPVNPYDDVDYTTPTPTVNNPDPNSIAGLHQNIFFPRCSKSGCHDGTFEPDFRTVQSTYSTLVYHETVKKYLPGSDTFDYRVIPYDTINSFLHERLTTSTTEYMPSNGTRLSREDINHINNWIMSGARDEKGQVPAAPDALPVFGNFVAANQAFQQVDTNRLNGILSPIVLKAADATSFYITLSDDITPINMMTNVRMALSKSKSNFSSAISIPASFVPGYNVWQMTFSNNSLQLNTQYYFRFYFNDGKHSSDSEFPRNDLPDYYKEYASLIVQ